MQENRSFDNLFQGFEGADTRSFGFSHDGTRVELKPVSLGVGYDIGNGFQDFQNSYDHGKMDGWDLRRVIPAGGVPLNVAQYPQFAYVPRAESKLYFEIAKKYVLADRMFQSNIDLSFAAHLYLIAAQAGRVANVPSGRPWGCDAYFGTVVALLGDDRKIQGTTFPCFDFKTLGDELTSAGHSWVYYAPEITPSLRWKKFMSTPEDRFWRRQPPEVGQLWSSYDSVAHDRYGPLWSSNVVSPQTRVLSDVYKGKLADVTWIVPSWRDSDHSDAHSTLGPQWVTAVVNAVGKSKYWSSTAIVVLWDDSGGWYDHVPPPQLDFDGLGVRIPLIVVSPYAKRGYVSHVQYEAGSIPRFIEQAFDLAPLAASDRRSNDFIDVFDFGQQPRPYEPFGPVDENQFLREVPSGHAPDND